MKYMFLCPNPNDLGNRKIYIYLLSNKVNFMGIYTWKFVDLISIQMDKKDIFLLFYQRINY